MRLALTSSLFLPVLHAQTAPPERIRSAAEHSVAMIQQGTKGFYGAMVWFSCHDHGLPMLTFKMARERGIPAYEVSANEAFANGLRALPGRRSWLN